MADRPTADTLSQTTAYDSTLYRPPRPAARCATDGRAAQAARRRPGAGGPWPAGPSPLPGV